MKGANDDHGEQGRGVDVRRAWLLGTHPVEGWAATEAAVLEASTALAGREPDPHGGEVKFHLDDQQFFQLLADHFGIPHNEHWVMHLDVPRSKTGGGYTIDVEFEKYDPHQHAKLRNAPPLLRLVKDSDPDPEFMTVEEVATLLRVGVKTIRRRIDDGEIPIVPSERRPGRRVLVPRAELMKQLAGGRR